MFADKTNGFEAILTLRNYIHILDVLKQERELISRQLLIIHDQG